MEYVWNDLHYESVYFKELHNEQGYYWPTIYRAGATVVSTITSLITDLYNFVYDPMFLGYDYLQETIHRDW